MSEMDNEKYIAIKKNDWIIILVLLLLPLLIKTIYAFVPSKEVYYQIKHYKNNSEIIENIEPSKSNESLTVQGKIGSMIIELDNEKGVRVASSTCPCLVCVNCGWTKNEALICVPNAVVVQPINKTAADKVDAITR
ncbi:MAG: NusG domain II-containing protein [Candidatus Riflebacteria bacterium]|nr:NusG domain II-containing protein [Candidatus Riflebacteria bacterium]